MIVCNMQMEDLEELAIAIAPTLPHWWYCYVGDTHTKLDAGHDQAFTDHPNSVHLNIQFTTKGEGGALVFLDTFNKHSEKA